MKRDRDDDAVDAALDAVRRRRRRARRQPDARAHRRGATRTRRWARSSDALADVFGRYRETPVHLSEPWTPASSRSPRAAKGFMPDDEGLALHAAGLDGAARRARSSRSAPTAASRRSTSAPRRERGGTVLFTVDHHRGSEENQAGWEHHDPSVVDPRTGRMDTLPFFRRTIEDAGLEDVVVAVIGDSPTVAAHWAHAARARCSSTAVTRSTSRSPTTRPGRRTSRRAACSSFHDVFEDPADGGQAPFEVWTARGAPPAFTPVSTTGSLRVLRR